MRSLFIHWQDGSDSRFTVPDDYDADAPPERYTIGQVEIDLSINWEHVASAMLTSGGTPDDNLDS